MGTWAVRAASNRDEFVSAVSRRAGVDLQVLSAQDEARLVFHAVRRCFDLRGIAAVVMDVGGGSTEFVLASGDVIDRIFGLPLGGVGLTELFGDGTDAAAYRGMRRRIREALRARVGRPPFAPHLLIGTGGTFTSLASMAMDRGAAGRGGAALPFSVRGWELQRSEVRHILNRLRKMKVRERSRVGGLSPERADIIVAGLAIVDVALGHFGVNRVRVGDQGLRSGVVAAMIDERWPLPGPAPAVDRMRGVRRFAAACRYEAQHAANVAELAVQLFDQLAEGLGAAGSGWAASGSREILQAAALLHDVGYFVNYERHHKHSYHLIIHSGLPGFTSREIELIASIARYHRGALPGEKHAAFRSLGPDDRDLVRRLAGILRIAVGLDRSHAQEVRRLGVRCKRDAVEVMVDAAGDPSVDLWAAQRRSALFEEAFGRRLRLEWRPEVAAEPEAPVVTDVPEAAGALRRGREAV